MVFGKEDGRVHMRLGYARVSTDDQSVGLQLDALKKAGWKRIFTDKVSTTKALHPGLTDTVSHLRTSDVLVIWKLLRSGMAPREVAQNLGVSIPRLYRWLPASSQ
jgi:DNA invertase Pin-like site-specific DNA recombinase